MVPIGDMGSFWAGVGPFSAVGQLMGCVKSRQISKCTLPSKIYPAGKLQ